MIVIVDRILKLVIKLAILFTKGGTVHWAFVSAKEARPAQLEQGPMFTPG